MRVTGPAKASIFLGGLAFFGLLYHLIIISPALSRLEAVRTYIAKREVNLIEMMELKREWEGFQRARADAERKMAMREKTFTLLSFLEEVTRQVGVEKSIQYIKPLSFGDEGIPLRSEGIEMQLENIETERLVDLLEKIEYSGNLLSIKRIKILGTAKGKERSLTVTLQVKTYVSL